MLSWGDMYLAQVAQGDRARVAYPKRLGVGMFWTSAFFRFVEVWYCSVVFTIM